MGDLNINLLVPSGLASRLLLATSDNNLKQLITEPTRITKHSQTLIDVLFTSSAGLFSATGTSAFTGSDHLMIFAECVEHVNTQSKVTTVRCFKKCDTDELTLDFMNAPWQVMDTFDTVDDMWDYWKTLFLDKQAPLKKVRLRKRGQDDEWIDSELREGSCKRETIIEINIVRHMLRTTGTGTRLYDEK